ncbi:MAG: phytanoyl-CoA dioxygenase [Sphingomonas sp.]|nr:MAG: phytanoyl-CoA dioxygenase [Sphingomonas sp.]
MFAGPRDSRPPPTRTLLDVLGVGLEQVMRHLGDARPGFDDFADWIVATAGAPDPAGIARYHAWYEGAPPPAAEVARQAAVMAAEPVFGADELAAWERDGVIVLRNAVTRDEARAIAEHLWAILGATPGDSATWYAPRTNGIMVQHFQHPAMDVPRRSLRVHKAFAQLYGHADLIASTDRLSFNPPVTGSYAFPGPHLHWDISLAPPIPFETGGILYLTDTVADQGALQVVPGFHRRLAEGWLESLGGADPRQIDLSGEAVTVPAGAGDLVIWRQEIPHGASANTSDRPRLAQYVTMYPMHWPDERDWI